MVVESTVKSVEARMMSAWLDPPSVRTLSASANAIEPRSPENQITTMYLTGIRWS